MLHVVLDSGHGGIDPGAVAKHNGVTYKEKSEAWSFCQEVASLARGRTDVAVYVVPHNFPMLYPHPKRFRSRVQWANSVEPDAFVSIHLNAGPPKATGCEAWYAEADLPSRGIGLKVSGAYAGAIGIPLRPPKDETLNRYKRLAILHGHKAPVKFLLELCFITNPDNVFSMRNRFGQGAEAFLVSLIGSLRT